MERNENPSQPASAPAQTIVIDRRERGGLISRIIGPILLLLFFAYLFGSSMGRESGLPEKLNEHYVAGELTGPIIAIVQVGGLIMGDEVDFAIKQIRQAREDSRVRAVVLRVDSPGGTVSGADRIWREVQLLKQANKPVVTSMGGLAASGGYYVAAPTDYILAEPTTMTGSIGVILEIPEISGLLKWAGVEFQTLTTGEWKDSPSVFRPMKPSERLRWQEIIDETFDRFVNVVAQGRKLPESVVRPLANGKVYTAEEALKLKLINEIGYQDDAILHAQRLARIESFRVIRYAKPKSPFETLFGTSTPAPRPGLTLDPDAALTIQTPRLLLLAR